MRRITRRKMVSAMLSLSMLLVAALPVQAATLEADPKDKQESVYVTAGADGTAKEVEVEVTLRAAADGSGILDRSTLTNIRNTQGEEAFTKDAEGNLLWENFGEDIRYKGDGSVETLPIKLYIQYTLDGMLCTPQMLAGKSGHLVMRVDYTNLLTQTVEQDGKTREVPVPLTALTLVPLDADVFSNVSVTNGEVISLGDSGAVVGMVLPGLREALALDSLSYTEDVEIPEYLEIEADVTDFSLDFTATMVSTGLLNDVDDEDLSFDNELEDADTDIDSAIDTMYSAANQLSEAIAQVRKGLKAINEAQSTGLDNLTAQSGNLKKLFGAFTVPEDDPKIEEDESLQTLAWQLQAAKKAAAGNEAALQYLEKAEEMMEKLKTELLPKIQEENEVAIVYFTGAKKGVTELDDGLGELEEGVNALRSGISEFKNGSSGDLKKLSEDAKKLQNILDNTKALKQAGLAYTSYSGLAEGKTGSVSFLYETEEIK